MSGYVFEYKIKKYFLEVTENFEDTDITRVFIYVSKTLGKNLIEVMDFPYQTDKLTILNKVNDFLKEFERATSGELLEDPAIHHADE